MMHKDAKELMRNTMSNLEFVEAAVDAAKKKGEYDGSPHEVTQLVNSFLGALAHPWEQLKAKDIWENPEIEWPAIFEAPPQKIKKRVRLMRNALAHGNLLFEGNDRIEQVTVWNLCHCKKCTWTARLSIEDLRKFLECFQKIAEDHTWKKRLVPSDCPKPT